jgi:hypothetical protein
MTDTPTLKSLTPILLVGAIEPCLPFWHKLGFATAQTVPDSPPCVFAILVKDGIEIMLQTRASAREDVAAVADSVQASILYVRVASLQPVLDALPSAEVAVPQRTTFYGADEIFLRDPAGNVIGFAAPSAG